MRRAGPQPRHATGPVAAATRRRTDTRPAGRPPTHPPRPPFVSVVPQVGATGPGIQLDQDITWYLANTNNTNFLSTATFPAGTIPGGSSVAEAGLSQPLALHLGQPVELSLTATWDPGSEAGAWQALRVLSTQPVQA